MLLYGKNDFIEISKNLARSKNHTDLKIILLDHQNN